MVGPIADQVAGEMRAFVRRGDTNVDQAFAARVLQALGGRANVVDVAAASTRLLVTLRDDSSLDEAALRSLDLRGIARPAPGRLHLLVGPQATALGKRSRRTRPFMSGRVAVARRSRSTATGRSARPRSWVRWPTRGRAERSCARSRSSTAPRYGVSPESARA